MPIDPARWDRIQRLFHEALSLPDQERRRWLEAECGEDPALAAEVLAMLAADARQTSPLDGDLPGLARDIFDGSVPLLRSVGSYRVLGVLGRGGMGVVYLAERQDLGSRVAIKVLRDASLSPARRARFRREERTLAQLNHPAIARLFDADALPDGTPFFVMEYVEGIPLTDYCAAHECSLADRLALFRAVCEAVQHAHRHAIVHRDLKPSNVLVSDTEPGAPPQVKLLDFGIAKQLEYLDAQADQTQTELRLMTPAYAAPEQIRGEPVGTYTDIYSLGVVLYELLARKHPFHTTGLAPGQMEARVLSDDPERPSLAARSAIREQRLPRTFDAIGRTAWADLDVLCLTAMHKDPQRRYATVEALIRDLDHFETGTPLDARPDTVGYRAGKFLRRHRRSVAAAAAFAAGMFAVVGFYTVRLAEQRDRAQTEADKADRIAEYLIGLFEAADPYSPETKELDVGTILARGEQRAEQLYGQPAVKAAMMHVLGRVHTQLSDYEKAADLLNRALELRRSVADPLALAQSLAGLAALHVDQGEYDEAEAALREALMLRERHLPPNHAAIASTLSDLGTVFRYTARYREAEEVHRVAVRIRRAIHDLPHEDLAYSLNGLAASLFDQGRYVESERYYREALAVSLAVFGPEHPGVTRILANLGKLYEELGDLARADSLLTEALRIRRATLGDDHFETAVGLGQLASVVNLMGQHERAEAYLRESLAIRERILAPTHPSIGTTLNNLASTLERRQRYAEAADLYRRAVDIYRESLGPRHRFTGIALSNLGHMFHLLADHATAETHFREAVSILEEVHTPDHPELAHNRARLGAVLVDRGQYAEAAALLTEAHRVLVAQLGPDHDRTRGAQRRLAELGVPVEPGS